MKKKLILSKTSIIGYLLILIGLLFVSIPLTRRSINDYKAFKADQEFIEKEKQRPADQIKAENENAEKYNEVVRNSDLSVIDPFTADEYQTNYVDFKNTDTPFAYLLIPKLDKNLPIYLDANNHHLAIGVAQVDGTSIPIGGANTRSVIAGHRGYWGDTIFLYLDQLEAGDYVYVQRADRTMRYVVSDKEVIGPYDWNKLKPREDEDMLTLLTCSPFLPPRPNRLLVNCIRDEETKEIAEEFTLPSKDLPISQNEEASVDKTVTTTRIITLILAIIAIILFILILIRFINRIRNTISYKKH
ncbi:class C sortase [Anaerococcus sp. Marseille-P3625]|uniref:class C sortase n=1 Tax=Anaerococcus sp. Marseille-P3625 TaxID=1977277 RepID=UPI000C0804FE|nr:class C sortase [Anaerococcus sp. Marseille-P3625]